MNPYWSKPGGRLNSESKFFNRYHFYLVHYCTILLSILQIGAAKKGDYPCVLFSPTFFSIEKRIRRVFWGLWLAPKPKSCRRKNRRVEAKIHSTGFPSIWAINLRAHQKVVGYADWIWTLFLRSSSTTIRFRGVRRYFRSWRIDNP